MQDHLPLALKRRIHRLHKPLASGGAVTRINIYMFAPEAPWAMVGVPIPHYFKPAPLAGEVLFIPLEFLR